MIIIAQQWGMMKMKIVSLALIDAFCKCLNPHRESALVKIITIPIFVSISVGVTKIRCYNKNYSYNDLCEDLDVWW